MRLVVVESPFSAATENEVAENIAYARACMSDCLRRVESPYASHLLFTQEGILDDNGPHERRLVIDAWFAWGAHANAVIVYTDRGIYRGMKECIKRAELAGQEVVCRSLAERLNEDI